MYSHGLKSKCLCTKTCGTYFKIHVQKNVQIYLHAQIYVQNPEKCCAKIMELTTLDVHSLYYTGMPVNNGLLVCHSRRGVQVPCVMCDLPNVTTCCAWGFAKCLPSCVSCVTWNVWNVSLHLSRTICGVHLMSWIMYQWQICFNYVLVSDSIIEHAIFAIFVMAYMITLGV